MALLNCEKIVIKGDVTSQEVFLQIKEKLLACANEEEQIVLFFDGSKHISSAMVGLLLRIKNLHHCKPLIEYNSPKLYDSFEFLKLSHEFEFSKV